MFFSLAICYTWWVADRTDNIFNGDKSKRFFYWRGYLPLHPLGGRRAGGENFKFFFIRYQLSHFNYNEIYSSNVFAEVGAVFLALPLLIPYANSKIRHRYYALKPKKNILE